MSKINSSVHSRAAIEYLAASELRPIDTLNEHITMYGAFNSVRTLRKDMELQRSGMEELERENAWLRRRLDRAESGGCGHGPEGPGFGGCYRC